MTTSAKIHRIRFYEPDNLLLYHAMDYDHKSNRLAVLKKYNATRPSERCVASDVIELIDCSGRLPIVYQRIHEDECEPNNLETIAWGPENYFFSAGMSGVINQYELDNNLICKTYKVDTGIAVIWAISYNPHIGKLAVASDSGLVKVFTWDSTTNSLDFGVRLGTWQDRLLSLTWVGNDTVVTGSISHIAIWSVPKARCLEKLLVGEDVTVWCLKSYKNIVVSGDSTGHTTFWNIATKSKITAVKSHEADILSIAVSSDGIAATCGVDQLMVLFDLKPIVPMKTVHYRLHSHDVKCMIFGDNNVLFSGGSDSFLGVTDTKVKSRKKAAILHFPDLTRNVVTSRNEVMFVYRKAINIYSLEGEEPTKLEEVTSKYNILLATFNSSWLVYATRKALVILERKASPKGDRYISKVSHDFTESPLSIDLAVLVDECKLVVACDKWCFVMHLQSNSATCQNPCQFETRIASINANESGDFIVCLINGDVYHTSSQRGISLVYTLPSPSLDCAFDPDDPNTFWFLLSDLSVIKANHTTKKTEEYELEGSTDTLKCRNIVCCNKRVIIYSDERVFSFSTDGFEYINCLSDFKHIVSLQLSRTGVKSEIPFVMTEFSPESLLQQLPASYQRHKGTIK